MLTAALAASFAAQPALGVTGLAHAARVVERERAVAAMPRPEAGSAPSPPREWVASRLVAIDRDPAAAWRAAGRLTAEDLEVLLANPAMLQAAGGWSQTTQAYFFGALIVAGIVAVAIAGNGFVMVN
jgi:hypothetical protein